PLPLVSDAGIRDSFAFSEVESLIRPLTAFRAAPGMLTGTYQIDWTATDSAGNTSTVSQFVVARPKIQAATNFTLLDSATIEDEVVIASANPATNPAPPPPWPNTNRALACFMLADSPTPACCRGVMWTGSGAGPTGAGTVLQSNSCSGSITSNPNVQLLNSVR